MNDWDSMKELHVLCGRFYFIHIYDEHKLVFSSGINSLKNVVMQA